MSDETLIEAFERENPGVLDAVRAELRTTAEWPNAAPRIRTCRRLHPGMVPSLHDVAFR